MLVFDADCGFCTRSARWVERRLPAGTVVVPWQRIDDLAALGLTRADVDASAWWIDARGRHGGHVAVARSLIAAGRGWRLVGAALLVPPIRWLAAPAYRWVARNRHRMPGGTPACRLGDSPSVTTPPE